MLDSLAIGYLAALGAAVCWALGGLLSAKPARALGSLAFNRIRLCLIFSLMLPLSLVLGGWASFAPADIAILALSGLVGIFIGDTLLFAAMTRLGPRRIGLIFATNAPMTAVLGVLLLDETWGPAQTMGGILVVIGVGLAVSAGRDALPDDPWEGITGPMVVGVTLGLLAALGQAVGSIIAKPAMADGGDALTAATIRVGAAVAAHLCVARIAMFRARGPMTRALFWPTLGGASLGLLLGMSLLMAALARGDAGVVAILSSTSPILVLPLLWLIMKRPPAPISWIGAILAVIGTGLIVAG